MIRTMKISRPEDHDSVFSRWWNGLSFIQKRMLRMSLSILVMLLCFPLYYLGFFGGVEGPLHPARLGDRLASLGVTRTHSMVFFLSLLIIAVCWNWIYNGVSLIIGARLTCNKTNDQGNPCGAPTRRKKVTHRKTGQVVTQYVCSEGHKRPEAHFHPIKKGTVSHTLWVIALAFCIIVFFLS